MNLVNRFASIVLTAGLAVWLESIFTVEWTYPYCSDLSDGPAYAAQGWPLPYWMWNGVVSLEHDFVPHIYVLNIVLLGGLLFPLVRWAMDRTVSRVWIRTLAGCIGIVLLLGHLALTILMISVGYSRPSTHLGRDGYFSYVDLRPVRIGFHRGNAPACTPSRFWFPDGWKHN